MEESLRRLYDILSNESYYKPLCLTLKKLTESKNFEEGKISIKVIDKIFDAIQKKQIKYDTIDIIFRILMSKKYGDTTLDTKIKRGTNGYFGSRTLNEEKIICGLKEYDKKNIHRYFFFESIVCSNFESCNITKSNFFKNLLLVPIKDIFVEENAFDTFDDIAYGYMQEEVLNNITKLLISDSFQNGLIKDDTWEFLSKIIKSTLKIKKCNIFNEVIKILISENFSKGLITYKHLELILNLNNDIEEKVTNKQYNSEYNDNINRCICIADVLTGENFSKGLIKFEDLNLIATGYSPDTYPISNSIPDNKLPIILNSENYAKGLIPHEWIVSYISLRESNYNYICGLDNIFLELITSKNYGNGIITKEQIEKILEILKNKCTYTRLDRKNAFNYVGTRTNVYDYLYHSKEQANRLGYKGFVDLLTSEFYQNKDFKYKDIEFLLDDEYIVFRQMIGLLLNSYNLSIGFLFSDIFRNKQEKHCILRILNPENRNILKEYINEFSSNNEGILSLTIATHVLRTINYSYGNQYINNGHKKKTLKLI